VGLVMWLAAAGLAEAVVWPGERRIQVGLTEGWGDPAPDPALDPALDSTCAQVAAAAAVLAVLFVAATVVMVGKP
jgi:hypothetical protein